MLCGPRASLERLLSWVLHMNESMMLILSGVGGGGSESGTLTLSWAML